MDGVTTLVKDTVEILKMGVQNRLAYIIKKHFQMILKFYFSG